MLVLFEPIRTTMRRAANAVAGVRGTRHVRYAVTGAARLIGLSAAPPEPQQGFGRTAEGRDRSRG